ncbi:hypothetical protein Pint_08108 [Pistacia integerrima]|uniref:Uncharacterized protein n=1 Tax=Pistacia integerrima TaxID=434235 RepID=A0ACC0XVN0_9ROSI|nr:hypothetical protein Pint_08108 [Pistacia integerrima]
MGNTNMDLLLSFQAFFLINLVSEFIIFQHYILQVWSNDVLMKSMQTHNGSILSICMEGKWLFTGGWDKTVSVQELMVNEFHVDAIPIGSISCGSVITALFYWQGKLFVGYADRTVKVYYYGK